MAITTEEMQQIAAAISAGYQAAGPPRTEVPPAAPPPAAPPPAAPPPAAPPPAAPAASHAPVAGGLPPPPSGFGWTTVGGQWALIQVGSLAPAAAAPPARPAPTGPPQSDAGGPAPPVTNFDGVNLFTISEADRAHLIKEKGTAWYYAEMNRQGRHVRVKPG